MNPARIIYEDAPAFIPVPADLQHRRVEAIFWPLDDEAKVIGSPSQINEPRENLPSLTQLMGQARGCFENATEIDTFIRTERDSWGH